MTLQVSVEKKNVELSHFQLVIDRDDDQACDKVCFMMQLKFYLINCKNFCHFRLITYFLITFVAPESDDKNEICSSEICEKESKWIQSKIDDAINP